MLAFSAYISTSTLIFLAGAESAEGRVIDMESGRTSEGNVLYFPVVQFRTAGGLEISFVGGVGRNPPEYVRGNAVTVLYDPAVPQAAKIDSFFQLWFSAVNLGILGGIFSLIGVGSLIWIARRDRPEGWLDRNGKRIIADIVDVSVHDGSMVKGKHPWRIHAEWQEPGRPGTFAFNSGDVWFDPKPYLQNEKIEVLIDPQNPDRYKIDLSFLPQQSQ